MHLVLNKIIKEIKYFPTNLFAYQEDITSVDVVHYIKENSNKTDTLLLGVFEEDCLLGTSRLHDIDYKNKTAHIGIFIFLNDASKKGLGTSVIKGITDYAFFELGIHTIYAGIFVDNTASVRAFTKAGFSVHDHSEYQGKPYQKWIKHQQAS